jgi:outer membrane receptor protein involved in Fe transport
VGAPIIKNKLFGFFDYEGTRIRRGITRTSTVPLPNLPGELNNYARTGPFSDDDDSYDARVDWNASDKNLVFFRYTGSNRTRIVPGDFAGLADGSNTSAWGNFTLNSYNAAIGWTRTINPSIVNDLRIGFSRNVALGFQIPFNLAPASDYVPGIPFVPSTGGGLPAITLANYTFLGSPDFLPKQQNPQQYQFVDTLSWNKGAHSIKFGVDILAPMRNIFQDEADVHGNLQFNGQYTGLPYADALTGSVQGATLSNAYLVDQRLQMYSGFVQDDWKVTPKLTLNLGLRYDFATPQYSGNNKLANFDPAGSGSLIFAKSGSLGDRSVVQITFFRFDYRHCASGLVIFRCWWDT